MGSSPIARFVFGSYLGLTPITGYCGGPIDWAYHLILPWSTFALLFSALYVRLIRAW